jgi:hypothetical protein
MADQFQQGRHSGGGGVRRFADGPRAGVGAVACRPLQVIFSVDLFNEGVDLPSIDTVMMLRPTESKILFLQQLGPRPAAQRRQGAPGGTRLHRQPPGFLQKPQALFGVGSTYRALAAFARKAESGRLELPDGCYVNYDLASSSS